MSQQAAEQTRDLRATVRTLDSVERHLFGNTADPDSIGRYVLFGKLGSGSMGTVYRAYDPKLDRQVAIKLLHPVDTVPTLESGGARLLREAQSIAKLCHPNVIQVHDVGAIGDRVFVAMEYVEGPTLREWCDAAPRSWREILPVLLQAGRGLAAAHARGLVHRDVKPDNILVGADGRVRVLDFSVARAVSDQSAAEERVFRSDTRRLAMCVTQTNALVGTPAYMAPEQLAAQPADARSDQFSFCITAYEALFGARPFRGQTIQALADAVQLGPPSIPPRHSPYVPRRLHRFLLRGLALDPGERWPDMQSLLGALERLLERRRRGPSLAVAAALGAAAVLLVGAVTGHLTARAADVQTACLDSAEHSSPVHPTELAAHVSALLHE